MVKGCGGTQEDLTGQTESLSSVFNNARDDILGHRLGAPAGELGNAGKFQSLGLGAFCSCKVRWDRAREMRRRAGQGVSVSCFNFLCQL